MNVLDSVNNLSQSTDIKQQQAAENDKKLKKACQDFESYFINEMFKSMRKTVPEGEFLKKGKAEKIYMDMMDQEVATQLSRKQSMGLSDLLYRQMKDKAGVTL